MTKVSGADAKNCLASPAIIGQPFTRTALKLLRIALKTTANQTRATSSRPIPTRRGPRDDDVGGTDHARPIRPQENQDESIS